MRSLRFDLKSTRSERFLSDNFCMVSEIWSRSFTNGQVYLSPEMLLPIDEQLLPTKSRYPYTPYMPNKPDKFGLKLWVLCEKRSKFVLNAFPYLGKNDLRPQNVNLAQHVVMELMQPYYKCGYNVTTDNFFTSAALADASRR